MYVRRDISGVQRAGYQPGLPTRAWKEGLGYLAVGAGYPMVYGRGVLLLPVPYMADSLIPHGGQPHPPHGGQPHLLWRSASPMAVSLSYGGQPQSLVRTASVSSADSLRLVGGVRCPGAVYVARVWCTLPWCGVLSPFSVRNSPRSQSGIVLVLSPESFLVLSLFPLGPWAWGLSSCWESRECLRSRTEN